MRRISPAIVIACLLFTTAASALVLQVLQLQDVQSNGTNLSYFEKTPLARKWNFKGGASYNTSTKNLDISTDWGGTAPTPTPSPSQQPGTCPAALRLQHYTIEGATGTKDLTYQCCQTTANPATYVWLPGYCQ